MVEDKSIAVQHPWGTEFISLDAIAEEAMDEVMRGNPEKAARVIKTEWQRWVPFLGIYRAWRDDEEHLVHTWESMHSKAYRGANALCIVLGASVPLILGAQYLMRALG